MNGIGRLPTGYKDSSHSTIKDNIDSLPPNNKALVRARNSKDCLANYSPCKALSCWPTFPLVIFFWKQALDYFIECSSDHNFINFLESKKPNSHFDKL